MHILEAKDWHFDVDNCLKPYILRNLVYRLLRPLSHFLGYRDRPRKEIGNIRIAAWPLLGAFVRVAVIEAAFMTPVIKDHGVPLLIASFVRLWGRILLTEFMLTNTGCCSDIGVQHHHRITARPASKHYNRTRLICHRRLNILDGTYYHSYYSVPINVAGDQQYPAAISYLLADSCECRKDFQLE